MWQLSFSLEIWIGFLLALIILWEAWLVHLQSTFVKGIRNPRSLQHSPKRKPSKFWLSLPYSNKRKFSTNSRWYSQLFAFSEQSCMCPCLTFSIKAGSILRCSIMLAICFACLRYIFFCSTYAHPLCFQEIVCTATAVMGVICAALGTYSSVERIVNRYWCSWFRSKCYLKALSPVGKEKVLCFKLLGFSYLL